MRLTTLARKIQITPTKLIEFLTKQNIKIDNGVNTKLDEETVRMTMKEFMPDAIEEPPALEIEASEIGTAEAIAEPLEILEVETEEAAEAIAIEAEVIQEVVVQEESAPVANDINQTQGPKAGTIEDLEMGLSEDIELIRAKKVKLEGIKVVGKIELPEKPKKAESNPDEGNAEEQATETAESKKVRPPKDRRKLEKQKNYKGKNSRKPLSYEERLKIEEREKRRIRKQKERKEKERKKKYYLENIQPKTTEQARKKKKKQSTEVASRSKQVVRYKNPFRRLWAWLNGEYDKY